MNSVVAFFYYAARRAQDVVPRPGDPSRGRVQRRSRPRSTVAIGLTAAVVVVVGVYPQLFARIGELAFAI